MKITSLQLVVASLTTVGAFQANQHAAGKSPVMATTTSSSSRLHATTTRHDFLLTTAGASAFWLLQQQPAMARGRATLEQSYERYSPRIKAGGEFYGKELRNLVGASDWKGIKEALAEVPDRKKEDLRKPDAGVAERARQAGAFSDARVLTAADLYAGAFSDNSISPKTKKMKASIEQVRAAVQGMQSVAKQALGEDSGGGLFGLGKSKPNEAELKKKLKEYYVLGGNAWNEYILAANDDLALKFDRFPFVQ
jgi:hypothetical protein